MENQEKPAMTKEEMEEERWMKRQQELEKQGMSNLDAIYEVIDEKGQDAVWEMENEEEEKRQRRARRKERKR